MNINSGLILPFRWYDDIEKQSRYKGCGRYEADDIRHFEYLISYGCRLLPFQIQRASDPSTTTNLWIVNVRTGAITNLTAHINAADWIIETIGEFDYITYLGNYDILDGAACVIDECVYYGKFSDGNNYWYSELFQVVQSGFDTTDYRAWDKLRSPEGLREWDDGELRITKDD